MEQKKPTNAQLLRRLNNALIHIDKTKDTQSIFFDDKGLRLTVNEEYAIIETGFHRHVFSIFTTSGMSRPYMYTKRVIEIALDPKNDCKTEDGYSFGKLLEVLEGKENLTEYNVTVYYEWWLQLIFSYLYAISENSTEQFLLYEGYLHHIARNGIILSEKVADITNKQFVGEVAKNMQEFINGIDEYVVFPKKTDEELMRENIEAMAEQQANEAMEARINESKD